MANPPPLKLRYHDFLIFINDFPQLDGRLSYAKFTEYADKYLEEIARNGVKFQRKGLRNFIIGRLGLVLDDEEKENKKCRLV